MTSSEKSSTPNAVSKRPRVSFVVPCYKLAHLLRECVYSILNQTFPDFEILIMDDCSPDNTSQTARSFCDPRIIYIRNETNIRHLRNYNKGISLARGDYIWLISADDKLRRPYVLERFVTLMDSHPEVGFAFCPGVDLLEGQESSVLEYTVLEDRDVLFQGRRLFLRLLHENSILSASGLVRRECYERLGMFPLDLPFSGDWYLWCLFSLHYDAAYFSEPMVCYREHELSMSNALTGEDVRICFQNDLLLLWRVRDLLIAKADAALLRACDDTICDYYAQALAGVRKYKGIRCSLSLPDFHESIYRYAPSHDQRMYVEVFARAGDHCRWRKRQEDAARFYALALRSERLNPNLWCKYVVSRVSSRTSVPESKAAMEPSSK